MRLIVQKAPLRRILKWTERALLACAILLLGFCAFALGDAWIFQRRENAELDRLLRDRPAVSATTPQLAAFPSSPSWKHPEDTAMEGLIGRLEIPRLVLSTIVVEGVDNSTLRRAVGHIPGTALPGQPGNVGLAGHRDGFFRPLKDLRIKDEVQFSTPRGDFKYQVESMVIVEPDNVAVLASSEENVLTLVTCYPFSYVGAAPRRLIVRARQVWPPTAPPSNVE
ncbi:MAG TPA: class D sortase [Bryobacteraceae bacterium]|nr:class D sortase [Bryobacteraceae bacterium]